MADRNVSSLLTNLPEDPDCSDLLEVKPVRKGDFRNGLRPGIDVTVYAKAPIPAGAVLGLYRNITVTKPEERIIQDNPPETFEGTKNEWCQKLDAYTADIEQPKSTFLKSRKKIGHIYEESLKVWCLTPSFFACVSCIENWTQFALTVTGAAEAEFWLSATMILSCSLLACRLHP